MSTNVTWHDGEVGPADRPTHGATVWLTGLSGSGKSTVAVVLEQLLVAVGRPAYRLDINTLHRDEGAGELALNEIGRVQLRTTQPLFFDEYQRNRTTGSFILIDDATNTTVGAGMIIGPSSAVPAP